MLQRIACLMLGFIFLAVSRPCHATDVGSGSVPEVCSYVADAYNSGKQDKIFANLHHPIDIFNTGKPVSIDVGSGEGSEATQWLEQSGRDIYEPDIMEDGIEVLSYRHRTYILEIDWADAGPVVLTSLGDHRIHCRFRWNWSAKIQQATHRDLCNKALAGEQVPVIPVFGGKGVVPIRPGSDSFLLEIAEEEGAKTPGKAGPVALDQAQPDNSISAHSQIKIPNYPYVEFNRAAFVDIANDGDPRSVGWLTIDRFGECINGFVTLLDKGKMSIDALNRSLMNAQTEFIKSECRAHVFPVRFGDGNFVEADHHWQLNQTSPSRSFFQLSHDKAHLVRRIAETVTYTAYLYDGSRLNVWAEGH